MDTTNGQTTEDSKGGGTKTNNTVSVCTLVRNLQAISSDCGKWESESNGSQMLSAT